MKNNKILYLLTILITLFSFNMKANAAQELTCVYEKGLLTDKIMFTQDKNGNKIVYTNTDDKARDDSGWKKQKDYFVEFYYYANENLRDEDGNFISCPPYAMLSGNELMTFTYKYSTNKKLEPNGEYTELTHPELELETTTEISNDIYCATLKATDTIMFEALGTYNMACVYALDIRADIYKNNVVNDELVSHIGCHIIQINANTNRQLFLKQSYPAKPGSNLSVDLETNQSVSFDNFTALNEGWCPTQIYVNRNDYVNNNMTTTTIGLTNGNDYTPYELYKAVGNNLITNEAYKKTNDSNIGPMISILDCESLFADDGGKKMLEILRILINLVKIAVPILLIGLGILDFAKAIFSGAEDKMKKAQEKFIKRVIIGVCVFLIPTIISYILELYNLVWDKNISTDFCGILR